MAKSKVQGEGDYEATRRYRKRTEQFLGSHDVEKEARRAAPKSREDARSMAAAEAAGKQRAKGEDPALRRRAAPRAKAVTGAKSTPRARARR